MDAPYKTTWLCPTHEDRGRVLEMEHRLKPMRILSFAALAGALLVSVPWMGWWPMLPLAVGLLGFVAIDLRIERARRPEYLVAAAWLLSVLMIAGACVKSGLVHSPALPWLAVPAVTLPARFRPWGVAAGTMVVVAVILVLTFGLDTAATLHDPVPVAYDLALIGSTVGFTLALMKSDLDHRGEAFIDPLTSMLNRHALSGRIAELAQHARVTRQPIALILCDIDHFKQINDVRGHATGDAVLQGLAYRLRLELRAYDLAYRLGGEEFLIVMPGGDTAKASQVAEALRKAVEREPISEVSVTMSFGVAASQAGDFVYESLFAVADAALYEAKNGGRNCVRVARPSDAKASDGRAAQPVLAV
jgi:diguanylate cyclase (GGDEF)-like protein